MEGTAHGKEMLGNAQRAAQEAIIEGREAVKKTAATVDKNVRENPWPYIGGAAVAALILGYLMGSRRK